MAGSHGMKNGGLLIPSNKTRVRCCHKCGFQAAKLTGALSVVREKLPQLNKMAEVVSIVLMRLIRNPLHFHHLPAVLAGFASSCGVSSCGVPQACPSNKARRTERHNPYLFVRRRAIVPSIVT